MDSKEYKETMKKIEEAKKMNKEAHKLSLQAEALSVIALVINFIAIDEKASERFHTPPAYQSYEVTDFLKKIGINVTGGIEQ